MAYRKAMLPSQASSGVAIHEAPTDKLALLVKSIVEIEAPVHEVEIARRLMEAFGVSRAGSRIVESVDVALRHGHRSGMFHFAGGFAYTDTSRIAKVRNRSALASSERKIEWVSPEEMDAALLEVIRLGFSISQDAAVSSALDSLGFGRATANISSAMKVRVDRLLEGNHLKRQEDMLLAV